MHRSQESIQCSIVQVERKTDTFIIVNNHGSNGTLITKVQTGRKRDWFISGTTLTHGFTKYKQNNKRRVGDEERDTADVFHCHGCHYATYLIFVVLGFKRG